jgi:GntR family histidine utilization transcriptional repressor
VKTTAPAPLYLQIQHSLQQRIMSGLLLPGDRIPPESELMAKYGCSRMTVNKALSALAAAGLVARRRRTGSVVAAPHSDETVFQIADLQAEVQRAGKVYRHELAARAVRAATEADGRRIGLRAGDAVLAVEVLHSAAGLPYAWESRLINLASVPAARHEGFAAEPPGSWLLRRIPWTEAEHSVAAIQAGARLAARLSIPRRSACLQLERRTWQAQQPVTWVSITYPAARHRLVGRYRHAAPAPQDPPYRD